MDTILVVGLSAHCRSKAEGRLCTGGLDGTITFYVYTKSAFNNLNLYTIFTEMYLFYKVFKHTDIHLRTYKESLLSRKSLCIMYRRSHFGMVRVGKQQHQIKLFKIISSHKLTTEMHATTFMKSFGRFINSCVQLYIKYFKRTVIVTIHFESHQVAADWISTAMPIFYDKGCFFK